MRVVLIPDEYPPDRGGIGISVQRIARNLAQHGVMPTVITHDYVPPGDARSDRPAYASTLTDPYGTEIHRIGPVPTSFLSGGSGNIGTTHRTFAELCGRLVARIKPDLIHSFGAWNTGHVATLVAKQAGLPHVLGVRGNDVGRETYNPVHYAALSFAFSAAAHVTFVSHRLRTLAATVFGSSEQWSVIHNGCDAVVGGQRRQLTVDILNSFPAGRPLVGLFGHLREKKGFVEALQAAQSLKPTDRPNIIMVGDDPRDESYGRAFRHAVQASTRAGIAVHRVAHLERGAALDIMAACDLIAQPSLDDGLPNTLLEAMALGRPILASEIFRDDIGEAAADFCDPYDRDSLSQGLARLVTDPRRRAALGVSARRCAEEKFTESLEAQGYVGVYRRVISRAPGRG